MTTDPAEWLQQTRQLPSGHRLVQDGWVLFPCGIHRDSDALARSNHRFALRKLMAAAGYPDVAEDCHRIAYVGRDDVQTHHEATGVLFGIASFRHWAVGWIDEIVIDSTWEEGLALRDEIETALENYPILDEHDYAQEEADEATDD